MMLVETETGTGPVRRDGVFHYPHYSAEMRRKRRELKENKLSHVLILAKHSGGPG